MIFTKTIVLMELSKIINDFADALMVIDSKRPIEGSFKPGIGPHTEDHSREMILQYFRSMPDIYGAYNSASSIQYPGKREMCDIVIPEHRFSVKTIESFDKTILHWLLRLVFVLLVNVYGFGGEEYLLNRLINVQPKLLIVKEELRFRLVYNNFFEFLKSVQNHRGMTEISILLEL